MLDYTRIIIDCALILIYLVIFFIFLEIKRITKDDFSRTFTFFTLALATLIITEIIVLLNNAYITFPYLAEILLIIFAVLFFFAACCMLRTVKKVGLKKFYRKR